VFPNERACPGADALNHFNAIIEIVDLQGIVGDQIVIGVFRVTV
jgi:hypothetical protein